MFGTGLLKSIFRQHGSTEWLYILRASSEMFNSKNHGRTFWVLVLIERNSKFGDLLKIKTLKKIERNKIKKSSTMIFWINPLKNCPQSRTSSSCLQILEYRFEGRSSKMVSYARTKKFQVTKAAPKWCPLYARNFLKFSYPSV